MWKTVKVVAVTMTSIGLGWIAATSMAAAAETACRIIVNYPTPAGKILALRGEAPLTWDTNSTMTATQDGAELSLDPCPSEFKPVLATVGQPSAIKWSVSSNYRTTSPSETQTSFDIEIFPHFFHDKGRVVKLYDAFPSRTLNNTRPIWAYLPPSYDENTAARYPVLYMHDGQNVFDGTPEQSRNGSWGVDTALDKLFFENSVIPETIVIGVGNVGTARLAEYTPTDGGRGGGDGDLYLGFLFNEVKPIVDAQLRTKPQRLSTWIAGSSLGGLISTHAAARWGAYVSVHGAFSPSTWWDNTWIIREVAGLTTRPPAALPARVYVDSGDPASRDDGANTSRLADMWRHLGYVDGTTLKHVVEVGGIHHETAWRRRFPAAFLFISGQASPP